MEFRKSIERPEIASLVDVIGLQECFVFDNLVDVLDR
jgi:hypothetical protein